MSNNEKFYLPNVKGAPLELISGEQLGRTTVRMEVPGGWVYTVEHRNNISSCFVPTPEWLDEETREEKPRKVRYHPRR